MENIKIFCGDNREIIPQNKGYSLVITSPTYDFMDDYNKYLDLQPYAMNQKKFLFNLWRYAAPECQLFYIHKPKFRKDGAFGNTYSHPISWLQQSQWKVHQEIIWIRNNNISYDDLWFVPTEERIFWLYKGKQPRKINPTKSEYTNVWPIAFGQEDAHAFNFPQALSDRILECFYQEGDLILDPYMGGGTVGSSCKKIGANFVGIEINKDIFNIAKERLE